MRHDIVHADAAKRALMRMDRSEPINTGEIFFADIDIPIHFA